MEIAMAAMAMIGSAGTAVATGATTVASSLAGAASSALAGSASALTSMQGAFSIASAMGSLVGGAVDMAESGLQARAERMQGEREALAIREETLKKIGDSRVAFGASGVSLASSSPVEAGLNSQSSREMGLARSGGRLNAGRARIRGVASLVSSVNDAASTMASYGMSTAARGVPTPA
jgi:hypothetical protein